MTLATWVDDKTIKVTVINGREARAIKRQQNKLVGKLQRKPSHCKNKIDHGTGRLVIGDVRGYLPGYVGSKEARTATATA